MGDRLRSCVTAGGRRLASEGRLDGEHGNQHRAHQHLEERSPPQGRFHEVTRSVSACGSDGILTFRHVRIVPTAQVQVQRARGDF
jgi:hypothetical protein